MINGLLFFINKYYSSIHFVCSLSAAHSHLNKSLFRISVVFDTLVRAIRTPLHHMTPWSHCRENV